MEMTSHGFVHLPNRNTQLLQTVVKIRTLLGKMWMYAYHLTFSWIIQAWEPEWGKGGRKKKKERKNLQISWLEWKWLHDVFLPPHCILCHITPAWDDEHLQSCAYKTLVTTHLGHWWGAEMWKWWRKKKALYKFPNWYIGLANKPPGKWKEPSAWIQTRMFTLKKKKKTEKRSPAAVLFYPLNYINRDSKGALQAFAGTKLF